MPDTLSELQKAVNDASRLGFSVIPIESNSKKPAFDVLPQNDKGDPVWEPFQRRRPTKEELKNWFGSGGRNLGIIGGPVSGGFFALDIDDSKLADEMEADNGLRATTTLVRTPNSGLHIWGIETNAVSRSGPLVPGVADLKAEGGYVLAPPSSIDDRSYKYFTTGTVMRVPDGRAWAVEMLRAFDVEVPDVQERQPVDVAAVLTGVPEGERDRELFRLAAKFRGADVPRADAEELVLKAAANCTPPFPERDALAKVASAYRYPPGQNGTSRGEEQHVNGNTPAVLLEQVEDVEHTGATRFARTDSGNAEMFAHLYGDLLRFDHRRKRWLRWSGHRWSSDPDAGVRRQAKASARKRYADAAQIDDLKDREAEAKWAITSESRMKLDAALSLAQAERPLADSGEGWDADPWLLGVANGVVDLRTGELRDGRQSDRVTMSTTVPYEPDASAPRWERFLDEVFAGDTSLVDYVQRASGYSLSGDTREQCFFVAWGTGWNGKSTLLRVLRDVAGDYAANTPFTTLEQAGRYNIPNDLAALYGKRLVTASELNEAARLNEARLKMLAGQDPVTARFLYGEPFTFVPAAKFWLAVNHKPVVHDDSTGFWRKVRLLPFVESFEGRADPTLEDALRREYPGVLSWMVRGCRLWLEEGLEPPASVRAATEEYQAESDPLADFLGEKCVSAAEVTVRAGVLYKAYKSWAESAGLKDKEVLTNTRFGATVRNRFRREHDRQGWFYTGIGLRS